MLRAAFEVAGPALARIATMLRLTGLGIAALTVFNGLIVQENVQDRLQ
jgi:hypothetical protein